MEDLIGRQLPLKFGSSFENGAMGSGATRTGISGFSSQSRNRSGHGSNSSSDQCDKYYSVRYDFKPASLDNDRPGEVEIQGDREVTITLPTVMPTTAGQEEDVQIPDDIVYKGNKKPAQKECLLIIDHKTGEVTLEKLDSSITVKKTRKEKSLKQTRPGLYPSSFPENTALSQSSSNQLSSKPKQNVETSNSVTGMAQDFLMNQDSNASEKSLSSDSSKHSLPKVAKKSKKEKDDAFSKVLLNRSPLPKMKNPNIEAQQTLSSKFSTPSYPVNETTSPQKVATSLTNKIQEAVSDRSKDEVVSKPAKKKETEKEINRVRNLSSSDSDSSSSGSDSSSWSSDNEDNAKAPKSNSKPQNNTNAQFASKVPSSFDLRDDLQLSDSD